MKIIPVCLIHTLCLLTPSLAEPEAKDAARAGAPCVSVDQLPSPVEGEVRILGSLFLAGGNHVNFIPFEAGSKKGVWTRSLAPELKERLVKQLKEGKHQAVIASCSVVVIPGRERMPNPNGATTGAYLGPVHHLTVTGVELLDREKAAAAAAKTDARREQIDAFLKRLQ